MASPFQAERFEVAQAGNQAAKLAVCSQAQCGLTAESENPQALADAVDTLAVMTATDLQMMGDNASRYYRDTLGLQVGVGKFAEVFRRLGQKVRWRGQ